MARRSSGIQPTHLIGALAILVATGSGFWWSNRKSQTSFTGSKFSAAQFQQNYIGMRGNVYVITGIISEQLRYGPDSSRLFAMAVKDDGSDTVDVGVLIPSVLGSENIQIGQEFEMQVTVDANGLLIAEKLRKT